MIRPTIGRRVWFWPNGTTGPAVYNAEQPCDAGVAYVWNERLINCTVADHAGAMHQRSSVPLLQDDDPVPAEGQAYATWMDYQKEQALRSPG